MLFKAYQVFVLKAMKLVQETSEEKLFFNSRQIARQMPAIEI